MPIMPLANAGWGAFFVASLLFAPFAVGGGLAVESLAFKVWLRWSWKRAVVAALVVNAISCGLGIVLLLPLEAGLEVGMGWVARLVGFLPPKPAWIISGSFLLAIVNVVLEYWPLTLLFRAPRTWRTLCVLFLANVVSVLIGFLLMAFTYHLAV